MKFILLTLLSFFFISCASHQEDQREPSSVDKADVNQGLNADHYNGSFR